LLILCRRSASTLFPTRRSSDLGGITVVFIDFEQSHVAPGRYEELQRELLDEVRSVPGVLDAATTTFMPLLGGSWSHFIRVGSVRSEEHTYELQSPDHLVCRFLL